MYLLIIWLPLLSTIIVGLNGRKIGEKGGNIISTGLIIITWIISVIINYEIIYKNLPCEIIIIKWISSGLMEISWGLYFDEITSIMLFIITSISSLVHLYSIEYMSNDPHKCRFMAYLSMFTWFMIILVTSNNYLQLFVGWEGVGISSYLLINFWFTKIQANKAAINALITNRIGDYGLIISIILIYYGFNTINYKGVNVQLLLNNQEIIVLNNTMNLLFFITLFILIGSIGKSAQIILHVWLPEAMAGPTPVSALIHAATMVTAGVFIILRSSYIFELVPSILLIIILIGSITTIFAGTTALVQNDIKKIIAYSTCSQLGYMILSCGLSNYSGSLFHLFNHAFFKALLFLSAGSIIHSIYDEQDMRKMGGIKENLPITYIMILIGSLILMGIPYCSGFYSKDQILEIAYSKKNLLSTYGYWIGTITVGTTGFYSLRLIYHTFIEKPKMKKIEKVKESKKLIIIPLILLSIFSITFGYLFKDLFIGLGSPITIFTCNQEDYEYIPLEKKLLPIIISITGGILGILIYRKKEKRIRKKIEYKRIYKFLSNKWLFDIIYIKIFIKKLFSINYNIFLKNIDKGILEIIGPLGISNLIIKKSKEITQQGTVYNLIFIILSGSVVYISIYIINHLNINIIYIKNLFIVIILMTQLKSLSKFDGRI